MIVYAYDWGCCDDVALALCAGIDIQKMCAHVITDHGCCVLAISQPSPTGLDKTMSKPQHLSSSNIQRHVKEPKAECAETFITQRCCKEHAGKE